jgi:plasmid stabilization system protein ParE
MRVYWTLEARARLLDIQAYIAQYSPDAARLVVARLLRRSRRFAIPPIEGRRLPEYPETELREVLEHPFRIIYLVKPQRIEVVTVKHYRQRLPRNKKKLHKT